MTDDSSSGLTYLGFSKGSGSFLPRPAGCFSASSEVIRCNSASTFPCSQHKKSGHSYLSTCICTTNRCMGFEGSTPCLIKSQPGTYEHHNWYLGTMLWNHEMILDLTQKFQITLGLVLFIHKWVKIFLDSKTAGKKLS